ncbi:hypothetical protein GCM10027590_61820 [Nocardiopsis nanhaiensis]
MSPGAWVDSAGAVLAVVVMQYSVPRAGGTETDAAVTGLGWQLPGAGTDKCHPGPLAALRRPDMDSFPGSPVCVRARTCPYVTSRADAVAAAAWPGPSPHYSRRARTCDGCLLCT